MIIQLRVVQFWSKIIRGTNRMISDQIALHSVPLLLSVLSIYQLPGGLKNNYWVFILLSNTWYQVKFWLRVNLRKRPTFGDTTTGFPDKWLLRNERRNSMLMTRHYPNLGSSSDWSCRVGKFDLTNQKHYPDLGSGAYRISALIFQTSFGEETSVSVANVGFFCQAS